MVRRRWLYAGLMILLAVGLSTRIPLIPIETSTEDYLFDSDPAKIAYDEFRDQFGRDQQLLILLEPKEVFDSDFLGYLQTFHRDLEDSVVHLDEVNSLINVRNVRGEDDELIVGDLLEELPSSAAEMKALRAEVFATPSYLETVVSKDGRIAAIHVRSFAYARQDLEGGELSGFDPEEASRSEGLGQTAEPRRYLSAAESDAFCQSALDVIERHRREDVEIHFTGQPLVSFALASAMKQDVPKIFGAALGLIGLLLLLLFKRFSPVVLCASVVVLSLLTTLGLSELIGLPIGLPTQIMPSFMLAVGVGYGVHLLTIFFGSLAGSGDRESAIAFALSKVGLPILMTALTTAAGLVAFVAAEMEQVLDLGVLGAVGVFVTFAYTMIFLPAVLAILPFRSRRSQAGLEGGTLFLSACARLSVRHPKKLVAFALLLAIGSIALIPKLDYSVDPMRYFEEGHWLRESTEYADQRMSGMQSLEVVIDTGRENGLHDVAVLDGVEGLRNLFAELKAEGELIGRTMSLLEIAKETHQALNENRPEFYSVPRDARLIAQEFLLFENTGSDDLEDRVDAQFSKARFNVTAGWEDGVEKQRFLERAEPRIIAAMEGLAEVQLTGAVSLIARTSKATSESLIQSYTLALVLITPLMILLIGSLRAGLVSMVPNLIPILASLGLMVVLGIELDLFTMLGACIAIGLAVDDSIHFIHSFRRNLEETGDVEKAVDATMASTGRALLFTSVVLAAGFVVLALSSMSNLGYLGG
ncbi:MAG: RND family transporter, partial [Myxococcota bacterium]